MKLEREDFAVQETKSTHEVKHVAARVVFYIEAREVRGSFSQAFVLCAQSTFHEQCLRFPQRTLRIATC